MLKSALIVVGIVVVGMQFVGSTVGVDLFALIRQFIAAL
jgi:hypothetical protein